MGGSPLLNIRNLKPTSQLPIQMPTYRIMGITMSLSYMTQWGYPCHLGNWTVNGTRGITISITMEDK